MYLARQFLYVYPLRNLITKTIVVIKIRNLAYLLSLTLLVNANTGGAQSFSKVAAGYYHNLLIRDNGSLWVVGANAYGQLGDGTFNNTNRPEQIVASNVISIAGGNSHSLFLKNDGSLWAMGVNGYGQLGDGTFNITNRPEKIVATNVTAVVAGDSHSLFLKSDGSLWAMGANSYGQLGDGTFNNTNRPEQIVSSNIIAIAAGSNHSLFLKTDGSLWGMGLNASGQLGNGTLNNTNRPVQIVATNVTAIAAGDSHSLFLKNNGSLWAMGLNVYGQLGNGTSIPFTNQPEQIVASNVTAITAGNSHSLFLKNDGSLWAMGNNWHGQLGDGSSGNNNQTNIPEKILSNGVAVISGGQEHSLLLKSDGSLWVTGANSTGQLGDGTYNETNRFEQIMMTIPNANVSVRLLNDGRVSLSYAGIAGTNYALDRTFNLAPASWVPQVTNPANVSGLVSFTNTPVATTNNFWRIRSVP